MNNKLSNLAEMDKFLERCLLLKLTQKAIENLIRFTSGKDMELSRYYFTIQQDGCNQKVRKWLSADKVVETLEHSYMRDVNVKWCCLFGKQFGSSLKSQTQSYYMIHQFDSQVCTREKLKYVSTQHIHICMNIHRSIICYSQKAKTTQLPIN